MAKRRVAVKKKSAQSIALVVRNPHGKAASDPGPLGVFERFAKAKTIDVDKLGKLIELQKDILHVQAVEAFNVAYVAMQNDLPSITKRGKITSGKGESATVRSRYAKLEDIQAAVQPILRKHGFAIRHRTEWPKEKDGIIRVVGILAHVQGHSEESAFEAPMDASEYRTQIQSMGSTVSYGRRYTTIDLLNLRQCGIDDDGQSSRQRERAAPPPPRTATTGQEDERITTEQRQRLFLIGKRAGRTKAEIIAYVKMVLRLQDSSRILRRNYQAVVDAIEKPGPLPEPAREPDEIITEKDMNWGLRVK